MPFDKVPNFLAKLRGIDGVSALALEFCIITATRSGEVLRACWEEINFDTKVWTIPAHRTKSAEEHRVPLPDRAMTILKSLLERQISAYVFPGLKPDRPLSVMALQMVLRRAQTDVTVHGFRSTFRDWCGERTSFPREVAEAALAHQVGNEVERAYRRGDALEKRRKLMDAWSGYCELDSGDNCRES
jgi:integrase